MNARPTILIVEDNPTNLKLATDVLEFDGYRILAATDAIEAMHILHTGLPDLILMDIQIPGQDGLSLTRRLKQDPMFKKIIIVALTASAMRGDSVKAFDAGCDGYITKPIETRKLSEQVAGFLNGATGAAGANLYERNDI